jgi:hypothetical protein
MLYGESAPWPRREGGGRKLFVGSYEFVRAVEKHPLTTRDCLATRNRSES